MFTSDKINIPPFLRLVGAVLAVLIPAAIGYLVSERGITTEQSNLDTDYERKLADKLISNRSLHTIALMEDFQFQYDLELLQRKAVNYIFDNDKGNKIPIYKLYELYGRDRPREALDAFSDDYYSGLISMRNYFKDNPSITMVASYVSRFPLMYRKRFIDFALNEDSVEYANLKIDTTMRVLDYSDLMNNTTSIKDKYLYSFAAVMWSAMYKLEAMLLIEYSPLSLNKKPELQACLAALTYIYSDSSQFVRVVRNLCNHIDKSSSICKELKKIEDMMFVNTLQSKDHAVKVLYDILISSISDEWHTVPELQFIIPVLAQSDKKMVKKLGYIFYQKE